MKADTEKERWIIIYNNLLFNMRYKIVEIKKNESHNNRRSIIDHTDNEKRLGQEITNNY
jgi:hypothetical protein